MVQSLTGVPQDILVEVLIRLPVKAPCSTRCVCRTFLRLSFPLDSYSIALHSSKATQSLIFQFRDNSKPLETTLPGRARDRYGSWRHRKFHGSPYLRYPSSRKFVLVNLCDGLLYLARIHSPDERSVVCNPVANEYIMIPNVDEGGRLWTKTKVMWLGYSPCANQYKVLRIFGYRHGDPLEVGAQVLVVGSSSWRDIEDMPLGREHSWEEWSTFLSGVLYWLDPSWRDIFFFDFDGEMFGRIALPPEFGEELMINKQCMSIGVLGDYLCLSYNAYSDQHVDLWVMRKQGDQVSWIKEFVIDTVRSTGKFVYGQFKPLQVLENGEILMF
ncbi:hypothetical protein CDL12_15280 [Handroanthus impetiginosus]|uniref:F-box associated beta-propeller type 1 domain-containing protein n=1 Tax=Handroanthus impetiginosus TaxID=429701 RepID=A0A2G9H480_9LAMI|nr:hypothetical protein CDL12_15280 [Handroanthus impetiginosus]